MVAGVDDLPELRWGSGADNGGYGAVTWCGNKGTEARAGVKRPRVGKSAASATPPAFKEVLLGIARSARKA